ncbi:IS3 family transposase, partial [Escherichia sp. HC-CC]
SGWLERVNAEGLIRSMSRKGCSPDNAACEGFFGRLTSDNAHLCHCVSPVVRQHLTFRQRYPA